MNTNIEIKSLYPFYPTKYPKGLNEDEILAEMCAGDGEWSNIDSHFYFPNNLRKVAFFFAEIDEVDLDKDMESISFKYDDYLTTELLRKSLYEKDVVILISRSSPNYPSYDFYGLYKLQRIPTAPGTNGAIDPYIPLRFILKETCYRL